MRQLTVTEARDVDHGRLGEICVTAYVDGDVVGAEDGYVPHLRDVSARARDNLVLAAYLGTEPVGSVTLVALGSPYAEIARDGEIELRMLAVAPGAQRRGVATALVRSAVETAAELGYEAVVLSSTEPPDVAERRYSRIGFERVPARDWVGDWDPVALAAGEAPTLAVWHAVIAGARVRPG